jgi:hypothetical protein
MISNRRSIFRDMGRNRLRGSEIMTLAEDRRAATGQLAWGSDMS